MKENNSHSSTAVAMSSVKEIFKTGRGPSSSHTIGPEKACMLFRKKHPDADSFTATLYGSLSLTGKGHGTDNVIRKTFAPLPVEIIFNSDTTSLPHPNTLDLVAFKAGTRLGASRVLSIGGGDIVVDDVAKTTHYPYAETTFDDVAKVCKKEGVTLWQYVYSREGADFPLYLKDVWQTMCASITRGLTDEGILPGGLDVHKRAKTLYDGILSQKNENNDSRLICAYAFAVGEQNAMGETIVTAPTCGAAGVLPSVLYHYQQKNGCPDEEIYHALAVAGLIGTLIKTNGSISGAECGCQAEIGSACAMAAAALCAIGGMNSEQIEYAAEIAIEHHLGLTCDPICGLVQIPCIERNAVAAMRAVNSADLAGFLWDSRKISLDRVIRTMKETGQDLGHAYRETSLGGLAKISVK